jgi:hypothetical protein
VRECTAVARPDGPDYGTIGHGVEATDGVSFALLPRVLVRGTRRTLREPAPR